jgi:hypothetical protein
VARRQEESVVSPLVYACLMARETTPLVVKDICALEPGEYEVEFVREQQRVVGSTPSSDRPSSAETGRAPLALSRCILRVSTSGEEVEDLSRATAGSAPGTKFVATVSEGIRYASFKPTEPPQTTPET